MNSRIVGQQMVGKPFWQPAPNAQGQFGAHHSLVASLRLNVLVGSQQPTHLQLKDSLDQWHLNEVERGELISKKVGQKTKNLGTGKKKLFSSRKLQREVLDENPQLKPTFPPYFFE